MPGRSSLGLAHSTRVVTSCSPGRTRQTPRSCSVQQGPVTRGSLTSSSIAWGHGLDRVVSSGIPTGGTMQVKDILNLIDVMYNQANAQGEEYLNNGDEDAANFYAGRASALDDISRHIKDGAVL